MQSKVEVKDGDIVLLSTDGLFDNMYEEEILKMIRNMKVCTYVHVP